jgi:hypothetical protein
MTELFGRDKKLGWLGEVFRWVDQTIQLVKQ